MLAPCDGTGLSLFQHSDTENRDTEQRRFNFISRMGKKVTKLSESYTLVPGVTVTKSKVPVPEVCGLQKPGCSLMSKAVAQENDWCNHLSKIITEGNYDTACGRAELHVSWAAYHSRRREQAVTRVHGPAAVTALLPLFLDDLKSLAMICHSMNMMLVLCTSFGRHRMLSGKHVSQNVTPHYLMNGANREQLKRHSSISENLCSAPSWMSWRGTDQSMKGTSFCMWRL